MTYDPAFMNTASCHSAITFIDGDHGILRYRGYPIEELAEQCSFLEVAYLLLFGELPSANELKEWVNDITHHTMLHESTKNFLDGFRYDAHPMGMLVTSVAALATVYPEARDIHDPVSATAAGEAPGRENAHYGCHDVPAQPGLSLRLPGQ